MLVTFTSSTSGEILMFSEIAHRLFEIVGKQGTARGVFTKAQLPDAIEKLRHAAAAATAEAKPDKQAVEESGTTPEIGLAQRAHSFIEMMERTSKEEGYVMWQAENDF